MANVVTTTFADYFVSLVGSNPFTCLLREHPISHLHDAPQMGYYCIYRRRQPGQLNYNVKNEGVYQSYKDQPDCANIAAIAKQHALQLTAAGIDHVMVVSTRGPPA